MTRPTLAQLRAIAEKATSGPWQNRSTIMPGDPPRLVVFRSHPEEGWSQQAVATTHVDQPAAKMDAAYADAAHIAAFNPAQCLALLDEIERLEAQLNAARVAARSLSASITDLGDAADDNDPAVMATAEPIGAAEADLWIALGIEKEWPHAD